MLIELKRVIYLKVIEIGLGDTYNTKNIYNNKNQDYNVQMTTGLNLTMDSIVHGLMEKQYIDSPFTRFHESIEQYPDFQDDIDDVSFMDFDNYERIKPFMAKEGTTVGDTFIIPTEDND